MQRVCISFVIFLCCSQLFSDSREIPITFENTQVTRININNEDNLKFAISELLKGPTQNEMIIHGLEPSFYKNSDLQLIDFIRNQNLIIVNIPSLYADIGGLTAEEQAYQNLADTVLAHLLSNEIVVILIDNELRDYWGEEGFGVDMIISKKK